MENAKKHALNLSRVTEQALSNILDYMETQNIKSSSDFSLSRGSLFLKREILDVPRAGFEPRMNGDISRKTPFFLFTTSLTNNCLQE